MVMNRLEAALKLPENQDPTKQSAIKQAKEMLVAAGVKDPGMELPFPVEKPILRTQEAPQQVPNFYIVRPVEGLVLPSTDQLVKSASAELKAAFGRDFEIPKPPDALFVTLQNFAERGITGFDEIYYLPGLQLQRGDQLWRGRGRVKPNDYFWRQIKNGNLPQEAAILEEGWYIGDRRGKPMYNDGKQRYGEDDYMEPLMAYLRDAGKIQKNSRISDGSRFGVSPTEIEGIILPEFTVRSEARGIVRNRRYIEFNARGNMGHPEYGKTDTWEWFGDPTSQGAYRLVGGGFVSGGLAHVYDGSVGSRVDLTGFSPVVAFPSKPR